MVGIEVMVGEGPSCLGALCKDCGDQVGDGGD